MVIIEINGFDKTEFKSQLVFHFELKPSRKAWIQLFLSPATAK